MLKRMLIAGLTVCLAGGTAPADTTASQQEKSLAPEDLMRMAREAAGGGSKKKESPYPDFKKVTKGMVSKKGLFTLWYYPPGAKDKDKEKLLCQIPVSFLGEQFMLSTSVSGGGFFTGFPLEERVVKWEVLDRKLLLVEPETRFVVKKGTQVSDVVRRTYPERIRASVPILTKSPAGDPVFDMGTLLKGNFTDVSWMVSSPFFGSFGRAGSVNRSLSKWTKKKAFELNVEIGVALAVSSPSPPGSYEKKMIHYSFWKLPNTGYRPRVADDRVGYFLTTNQDWTKPTSARDLFNRYINRWQLEKRDPKLPLCEPKQPIIYYIEKTVPVRFRRAVRDGILEWNKAFEKIGFLNAIEVRQQTYDNEWKDLDPEDMRYSFFRWIVTGGGFAMGPSRANPFTGQIYDADIVFDDSMVRFFERSAERNLPSAIMSLYRDDPALERFLERFPQFRRPVPDWTLFSFGKEDPEKAQRALRDYMRRRGDVGCTYAEGMKHQMAVASCVLAEAPPEVKEKLLYDVIKEVVSHEVGHTLGLRHNFKASTIYPLQELQKRRKSGEPLCGSVMDYNPVLFFKEDPFEGHFVTPTIGPYDYWAIEYGYRPADGTYKPPAAESPEEPKSDEKEKAVADSDEGQEAGEEELKGVPSDILEKLPEEVRKMVKARLAEAAGKEGKKPASKSKPAFKAPPSGEEGMLQAIASRAAEPQLAYATDEDTTIFSPDPRNNRFDASSDPIDWAEERIGLIDQRLSKLLDWAVKDKESWYHARSAFVSLILEKARVIDYVGRYIGGQYTSRSHRGDPDAPPPFTLVDAKTQRRALKFIADHLYREDFFKVSPEVLNHLAASRWWHEGTTIDFAMDFPLHDFAAALQGSDLFVRLFPNTLRRIYDAELRASGENRFTVAEYLQELQRSCWGDAVDARRASRGDWDDASPFVSSLRRSLQREYLNVVEPLVRTKPGLVVTPDVHAMLTYSLESLKEDIEKTLGTGKLDFASRAHLSACKSRIERMLAPPLKEYGS